MPVSSNVRPLKMSQSVSRLKQYRRTFGWLFVVSFLVLVMSSSVILSSPTTHSNAPVGALPTPVDPGSNSPRIGGGGGGGAGGGGPPKPVETSAPSPAGNLTLYISAASLLTSTASFAGFFFTSIVSWRKERREQRHSEVDLEKKKLEIEKLKRELEQRQEKSRDGQ